MIKDEKLALDWYEKAGKAGDAKGQHNAGIFYYIGRGVAINYPAAYEWFLKATNYDHAPSQYIIG